MASFAFIAIQGANCCVLLIAMVTAVASIVEMEDIEADVLVLVIVGVESNRLCSRTVPMAFS